MNLLHYDYPAKVPFSRPLRVKAYINLYIGHNISMLVNNIKCGQDAYTNIAPASIS